MIQRCHISSTSMQNAYPNAYTRQHCLFENADMSEWIAFSSYFRLLGIRSEEKEDIFLFNIAAISIKT